MAGLSLHSFSSLCSCNVTFKNLSFYITVIDGTIIKARKKKQKQRKRKKIKWIVLNETIMNSFHNRKSWSLYTKQLNKRTKRTTRTSPLTKFGKAALVPLMWGRCVLFANVNQPTASSRVMPRNNKNASTTFGDLLRPFLQKITTFLCTNRSWFIQQE